MKALLLFCLFIFCACSSSKISDVNSSSTYHSAEAKIDLTTELSNLPGISVRGNGRLAQFPLVCGSAPFFILNGQLEPSYSYVYDRVKGAKLKSIRIQNLSDTAMLGLRAGNSTVIVVETE